MPLDYRQVKDIYDNLHDAGVVSTPLPEWSDRMNQLTGSDLYSAGLHDNIIKRSSVAIDRLLEKTIPGTTTSLPELGESFGRGVGGLVGAPDTGASIGHSLPRMTANFLPLLAGAVATGGAAVPAEIGGLIGAGALSGAQTYTDTGSPAAGVLSGVTAGLLPPIAGAAERATLGALGTRLVEGPLADAVGNVTGAISKYFPTVTQDLLAKAGGQATAAGVMTASDLGQQKLAGQPLDVHPVDLLLNMTLGAAPFGLLHLGGRAFKSSRPEVNADVLQHEVNTSTRNIELRQVKEKLDAQSAVENLPKVTPTEDDLPAIQEAQEILAKSRGQQVEIKNNSDLSPEDKVKALSTLADDEAGATPLVPTNGTTVLGDQPDLSDRTQVVGTEIQDRAASRIIHVADFPVNPPELRGKVVIYSKGTKEPAPMVRSDGTTVFGVSAPQWRTVKGTLEEWNSKNVPIEYENKDLPFGIAKATLTREPTNNAKWRLSYFQEDGTPQGHKTYDSWHEANNDIVDSDIPGWKPIIKQSELPVQTRVMSDEELHDHMAELAKVNTEVDNAQTTADVAQAVVRLNHVEDANGLTLTTDSDLKKNVEGVETPEPVKAAIKAQTSKVARKIEALKQRQQDIVTGNEFRVQQEQLPEAADEVGKLHEIETQLASSRSSYADALVGGELNRMYRAWVQGGRVGGIEAFREQVGQTAKTGRGLFRNADITQAVREGAGPIGNLVDEQAAVVTHSPAGLSAYESWPSKDKPSFSQESGMFQTLVKEFGSIRDVDVGDAAQFLSDESEGKMTVAEAKDEVKDFLTRPHVKVWHEQLDQRLTQLRQGNAVNVRAEIRRPGISAGDGWLFSMGDYDPNTNVLNGKYNLPKDSKLVVEKFRNIAGEKGPLPKEEIELYKSLVPEAFAEGKVDVRKLVEGLKTKGPVVETKTLGYGQTSPEQIRVNELVHQLDTEFPNWQNLNHGQATGRFRYLLNEYSDARSELNVNNTGGPRYSFLGPKPESEMPGYVEGLVKIPGETKFTHDHFPGEKNVLSFYRGYEETLPDGSKAFHVIEVQSDWGQSQRKKVEGDSHDEAGNILENAVGHPLLSVYESLALKASLQHTRSIGATKVILSDAETAMMTEEHDRARQPFHTITEPTNAAEPYKVTDPDTGEVKEFASQTAAQHFVDKNGRVRQEKGMRLHYDATLPSAMEKLTGSKGEEVSLGVHKATTTANYVDPSRGEREPISGSPVFRDANGQPKTQITGRIYPVPDHPAFTLTGTRAELPFQPYEPRTQPEADLMQRIGTTGHSALQYLKGSDNEFYSSIAQDLEKFTNSLGRTTIRFGETLSGSSQLEMKPDGAVMTIAPSSFDNVERTIAHELVHALTSMELYDPTNAGLVKQFDVFRESVIEGLPKDQRERAKELIRTDWLTQYTKGRASVDALSPSGDSDEMQLMYALIDSHEMVSQGLTDVGFQDYLKSQKSKGKSFFSGFAAIIKNALGMGDKVAGTKFEEFLSLTDQLMQTGNFASSFRDFAERHFENQGMDRSDVNAKTQQALNVIGGVGQERLSPLQLLAKLNVHTPMYDDDPATTDYYKMLTTAQTSDEFAVTKSVMDEMGYKMGLTAAQQFARDLVHSGGGANLDSALLMLPDITSKFVYSKIKSMRDILGVIKSATDKNNEGLINLSNPSVFRSALSDIENRIEKVLDVRRDLDLGQQHIQEMAAIAPDGFVRANLNPPQKGDVEKVKAFSKDSITAPKKGLAYWLQPIAQLVRQDPRAAQLASKGFTLEPNARQFAANSLRVLGIDLKANDGVLSDNSVKAAIKTISTLKTQKAVDRWMAENNIQAKNEERGVTLLQTENPEVAKVLDKLTPEEREGVIDTVTKSGIMTQATHQQILGHIEQISNTDGGIIAMLDSQTTKPEVAVEMAGRVFAALNVDRTDPQAAQVADAQLKVVQERMSAPGFLKLLQFMQGEQGKYSAWRDYFVQNPYWATAQRQEKFLVEFNRGGKKYQLQASSEKEAKVIAEGGTNLVISDNLKGKNDEMPQLGPDTPALISRLKELQATQDAVMKPLMTPDAFEKRQQFDPVTQLSRELAATGGAPQFNAPPRLLSQGAEELPWLWNHISWVQRQSNYWTRQLFRAQSRLYLSSPELTDAPDLQKQLQEHVDNMLRPDPQLIQKVNHFTSTWFMGFAPASALINGMQTLSTLVPELTNISGRPVESYGLWRKSVSEVVGHLAKGGGKVWKDPEIDDLMRSGEKSGQVGFSMWDEAAQAHETISTNYKRAMMKNKPQDTWQRLGSIGGAWSTAAMWMFKNVEMFNQRVALVASYRQARDMGLGVEDAQKQAFEVNLAVNYGGGRAGRSTGLYSGKDQFSRGAAMLATNMQNYNLGVVSQLSRYLQNGLFRPEGLKPSQVHAARLAATQMLGTQLAAAGLLGLPFVSGAVAVLNQAFPGLEVNRRLRETMDSVLGSDKENGSVLSDAALTGLPSMLGWDMQSRLSWGNITPGVSEFNGFQPALMLGPPVNLVTNFVNGALKAAQGDPVGGEAFIPPGLKKLTQLVNSGGTVKDYRDRPLFNPTVGEQAGIALGFQPKRLSDFNAADRMRQLTDQNSRNRESQFNAGQAEDVVKGNFGNVRQQLQGRMRDDKNYDAPSAVRAIAQNAEDLTFPRDLRREGTQRTGADRSRLLSSFNLPAVAAVSEVDRLKFRQQVEQRLGLAQPQDRAAYSHAYLMDQLRRSNPDALRSELSSEADRVLHGRRRTASLLPELQ